MRFEAIRFPTYHLHVLAIAIFGLLFNTLTLWLYGAAQIAAVKALMVDCIVMNL
jgi:hypothetical protein